MLKLLLIILSLVIVVQSEPSECSGNLLRYCKRHIYPLCQLFCKPKQKEIKPVKIELYYEALCPDCQEFMKYQLYPTFQRLFQTGIFQLTLIPYGNAKESEVGGKWMFQCQHGEQECQMNLLETCAIHLLNNPQQFMPFIHCVELLPNLQDAQKCAGSLGIEWAPIAACYNGAEGNYLQHQMAQMTEALNPPHTYVPWVLVDGVHTEEIQKKAQQDLSALICENYKGKKPKECYRRLIQKPKMPQRIKSPSVYINTVKSL